MVNLVKKFCKFYKLFDSEEHKTIKSREWEEEILIEVQMQDGVIWMLCSLINNSLQNTKENSNAIRYLRD